MIQRPAITLPFGPNFHRRLVQNLKACQAKLPGNVLKLPEDITLACEIALLYMLEARGSIYPHQVYEVLVEDNPDLKPWLEAEPLLFTSACIRVERFCRGLVTLPAN